MPCQGGARRNLKLEQYQAGLVEPFGIVTPDFRDQVGQGLDVTDTLQSTLDKQAVAGCQEG